MNVATYIDFLHDNGCRITKSRRQILDFIANSPEPLSASELIEKLALVDRSTIYRELSFLKEKGIIRELTFGEGKSRFEIKAENCHHHLVCEECGNIEHIKLDEKYLLQQINSKFEVKRHSIEFFGICANCTK